jgi:6-phosphogluconolactonase
MPAKRLHIRRLPTPDAIAAAAAAELHGLLHRRDPASAFGIALSGGRIAAKFYDALAEAHRRRPAPLDNVHFFWADERCVSPESPENNFRTARLHLFEPLAVDPSAVHRIRGEVDCTYAVQEAEAELCRLMPLNEAGQPVLDVVILGMGEDGHVASLFPGESEELAASGAVYRNVHAVKPPPERVTLGYAPIAAAREVWVLASGPGKADAFAGLLAKNALLPIVRVVLSRPQTIVFQDIAENWTDF